MSRFNCPKCGTHRIKIRASVYVSPTEEGFEDPGTIGWDEKSGAVCLDADQCGYQGVLKEFFPDNSKIGEMRDSLERAWIVLCGDDPISPAEVEILQEDLQQWAEALGFEREEA